MTNYRDLTQLYEAFVKTFNNRSIIVFQYQALVLATNIQTRQLFARAAMPSKKVYCTDSGAFNITHQEFGMWGKWRDFIIASVFRYCYVTFTGLDKHTSLIWNLYNTNPIETIFLMTENVFEFNLNLIDKTKFHQAHFVQTFLSRTMLNEAGPLIIFCK